MSAPKKKNKTFLGPFDRGHCFTCFPVWVEDIRQLGETDPAAAHHAFIVLADYCLYGIEPPPGENPWGMAWGTVKSGADQSIKNRSRRFGTKDEDLRDRIARYKMEHPDATQREIAAVVDCSPSTVNKVLKTIDMTGVDGACYSYYKDYSYPRVEVVEQNDCEVFGFPVSKEAAR